MSHQGYRTVVLVGDDIYADIATCYLAHQLCSNGVKLCRVRGLSKIEGRTTINVDHSIHALNAELDINFAELMAAGVFIPTLVSSSTFPAGHRYFESYSQLKDDLPVPFYQVMARLIREGVAEQWESASPLVALEKAAKFHPELQQFYRGNVRPYGARINTHAYSKILNEQARLLGVDVFKASKIVVDTHVNERLIAQLHLDTGDVLQDAFYIDMTHERCLSGITTGSEAINSDAEQCGMTYFEQPWAGNCLALGDASIRFATTSAPVNSFEWMFKALIRFIDLFPCLGRQNALAQEYNRLYKKDCVSVADFLQVYHWSMLGAAGDYLPARLQHRVSLFAESCQLSEDAADWAYPSYWPVLLTVAVAGGVPQYVPRRVQEIPMKYLVDWYNHRLSNISHLVNRSREN